MRFLFGEHPGTMDPKRRVTIPAKLRERINSKEDGKDFVLFLGRDHLYLYLYPELYFDQLSAGREQPSFPTDDDFLERQAKARSNYSTLCIVKPDAQGRVVLPETSVAEANITEQIVLVGNDDHIEIWPAEEWAKEERRRNGEKDKKRAKGDKQPR